MISRPWLSHYDDGVPQTLAPYPERTLLDYFHDGLRERPDAAALLFKGRPISYRELERASTACAAAFETLGVRSGDRVALLLPNCPQFIIAQFAAWKLGAVILPLNPIYNADELRGPLRTCGATTIIVLTPFYQRIKAIQRDTALTRVIATSIKDYLPPVLRLAFQLLLERREGHRVRLEPGDHRLDELIARHRDASPRRAVISPADVAALLLSGGTTGEPKCAMVSHRAYVCAGLQLTSWSGRSLAKWGGAILMPLPLFHVYATVGVQSLAFVNHNPMALVPNPRDLGDVVRTIARVRPEFLCGVPTLFNALLNHPRVRRGAVDFTSIRACICGAAPLMAETKRRFEELTGGHIFEGYSLTEAGMACTCNPLFGTNKVGSVGLPLPDVEVRIVDADVPERDCATGESGEIIIRAPQLMPGYWENPDESARTVRTRPDGARWLFTGDLGYLDDDGYLFIVDRKKDLIKCSGYQVWPRDVEEAIASHPAVAEVGVTGVPDAAKGEAVLACIVLRPGTAITVEEIRAHCRQRLAPYKVPSRVEFRSDLPKSMVGKILRRKLREDAAIPAAAV